VNPHAGKGAKGKGLGSKRAPESKKEFKAKLIAENCPQRRDQLSAKSPRRDTWVQSVGKGDHRINKRDREFAGQALENGLGRNAGVWAAGVGQRGKGGGSEEGLQRRRWKDTQEAVKALITTIVKKGNEM